MPETIGQDVYTIPQEHLDLCATISQIAREKIAPRSAEIDERAEALLYAAARAQLERLLSGLTISSLYETKPVGVPASSLAKTGRSSASRSDRWMWQEFPSRASNLAMNVRLMPSWAAISFAPVL